MSAYIRHDFAAIIICSVGTPIGVPLTFFGFCERHVKTPAKILTLLPINYEIGNQAFACITSSILVV